MGLKGYEKLVYPQDERLGPCSALQNGSGSLAACDYFFAIYADGPSLLATEAGYPIVRSTKSDFA